MLIPVDEKPQFRCSACGSCCSHIRGFIPEQDRAFLKEYAFGRLPVVQLVPVERMTFPLWDWEASRFRQWGKEAGIDPRVKPLRVIYDEGKGTAIVLSYFMDAETDACPMLQERKCAIYHTKRAYVCRLFPFNRSPVSDPSSSGMDARSYFGECGAMEKILPELPADKENVVPFLMEAFPNGEFLNALQNDLTIEWSNRTIIELMQGKRLRPAMNLPYEELKKKMLYSRQVDFTDFLVECGHLSKVELDLLLQRFDENEDAREWVGGHEL